LKNIVIITPARCGSSWLTTAFEQHLGYNNFNAVLSSSVAEQEIRIAGKKILVSGKSTEEKIQLLEQHQPFVVKVFTDEMIDLELLPDNTEYIWLYRKNLAEHCLSFWRAKETGVYNLDRKHGDVNYVAPTELPTDEYCAHYVKQYLQPSKYAYEQYQDWFWTEISYEELFTDNPWGFAQDNVNSSIKLNTYTEAELEYVRKRIDENTL